MASSMLRGLYNLDAGRSAVPLRQQKVPTLCDRGEKVARSRDPNRHHCAGVVAFPLHAMLDDPFAENRELALDADSKAKLPTCRDRSIAARAAHLRLECARTALTGLSTVASRLVDMRESGIADHVRHQDRREFARR